VRGGTMLGYGAMVALFLVLAWAAAHHEEA
jgi:hypothetical protein